MLEEDQEKFTAQLKSSMQDSPYFLEGSDSAVTNSQDTGDRNVANARPNHFHQNQSSGAENSHEDVAANQYARRADNLGTVKFQERNTRPMSTFTEPEKQEQHYPRKFDPRPMSAPGCGTGRDAWYWGYGGDGGGQAANWSKPEGSSAAHWPPGENASDANWSEANPEITNTTDQYHANEVQYTDFENTAGIQIIDSINNGVQNTDCANSGVNPGTQNSRVLENTQNAGNMDVHRQNTEICGIPDTPSGVYVRENLYTEQPKHDKG